MCLGEDGVHLIILGCTDFEASAPAISEALSTRGHDVPIISPNRLAIRHAETLVGLGLTHSRLSYPAS